MPVFKEAYSLLLSLIPGTGVIIFNRSLDILDLTSHGDCLNRWFPDISRHKNIRELGDSRLSYMLTVMAEAVCEENSHADIPGFEDQELSMQAVKLPVNEGSSAHAAVILKENSELSRTTESYLRKDIVFAEEASQSKSDFIASLSHEIRTPLNAIIGFLEQLQKTSLDEKQQEYLEIIDKSSSHLLDLVNETLTFSKLESGELRLDEGDFNLKALLDEIYETFRIRADKKMINFRYHVADSLGQNFRADAFRLKQIIINLVGNAIKFTDYGYIELDVSRVKKSKNQVTVRFKVTDSGIGISKDKIRDIFTQYRQASAGITRRHGGTGLGLTISKRLTELMGGTLAVRSTEGKGSVFTAEIPLQISPLKSLKEENYEIRKEVLAGRSVLIVDDDALNRLLGKIILEDYNMEVDLVSDGREALKMLEKKKYDVLLLDIHMPGMSGLEVARHIRKELADEHVKIIAVTAAAIREDIDRYFEAGINDYMIKPYREINLYNIICKALELKYREIEPQKSKIILKEYKDESLFDLKELEEITKGNKEFHNEMIQTFINNAKKGITGFKTSFKDKDWETIGETAHKLIPSYKHLRINKVVSDLVELKHKSRKGKNPEEIDKLISRIERETNKVIKSLQKLLR